MVPSSTASHSGPEAAKQPQVVTLPPPFKCSFIKRCVRSMPDVHTQRKRKDVENQDVFSANVR